MVKGLAGAIVASFLAWVVMKYTGFAADDGLYVDLVGQVWGAAVDAAQWATRAPEHPQPFIIAVAAVVGYGIASKDR